MLDCEHRNVYTRLLPGQASIWVCVECGREVATATWKVKEEPDSE